MKSRFIFAIASLAFVISGALTPAHAAQYKMRWYLAHRNIDFFEETAARFKKQVETRTHGNVSVDVVAIGDDAKAPDIAGMVERGEAEMGHSFTDVVGGVDPRLYAFQAPFLFRDYQHMEGIIEGPLGAEMLENFKAHHMVGLSLTYSGGASEIATVDRELRKPSDLKGLRVAVYGDPVTSAWLKSLGATPVPVGHDTRRALDESIDAAVVTWRNFGEAGLNRKFKLMNLPGSTYLVSVTYINEKFLKSLPEAYQSIILDESRTAGRIERAKTIELNESSKRSMLGQGVRAVYLSKEGEAEFASAVQPAFDRSIDAIVGRDFVAKARKTADGPELPPLPVFDAVVGR
jgi:C4-dicarboxylate-binding protein DctP